MRLLVTGAWKCTEEQLNMLRSQGHEISFLQNESDDLPKDALKAEGVICNGLFLHHDIREFGSLRYIQLTSAGMERVPMDYVEANRIEIHNARGVYSIPMAEFAVAGVLSLYKKQGFFHENRKKREWKKDRELLELFGKTVTVVGFGSVGYECAKRFSAFGVKVLAVDIVKPKCDGYDEFYNIEDVEKALGRSDITVLTLPLTEQTKNLINKKRLSAVKEGAILVNIARGQIVNTGDLLEALKDKRLSGAVLDVFEEEPLPADSPLWCLDNVILTPHNSFVGDGNAERLWQVIKNNLENVR